MRRIKLSECNKAVTLVDGDLFIGGCKVIKQSDEPYAEDLIPALYMVRVWEKRSKDSDTEYPVIVCGLDLMKSGLIWLGSYPIGLWKDQRQVIIPSAHYGAFETVEHILNTICSDTIGKRWEIFEEEDFDASFAEYNAIP